MPITITPTKVIGKIEKYAENYINISSCPTSQLVVMLQTRGGLEQNFTIMNITPPLMYSIADDKFTKKKKLRKAIVIVDSDCASNDLFIRGLESHLNYKIVDRIIFEMTKSIKSDTKKLGSTRRVANFHHTLSTLQSLNIHDNSWVNLDKVNHLVIVKTTDCWIDGIAGMTVVSCYFGIPYVIEKTNMTLPPTWLKIRKSEFKAMYNIMNKNTITIATMNKHRDWEKKLGYTCFVRTEKGLKQFSKKQHRKNFFVKKCETIYKHFIIILKYIIAKITQFAQIILNLLISVLPKPMADWFNTDRQ